MSGIWEEVKGRKIFRVATIYAAIAWGVIQIADVLLPVLGISSWVMSSMVLLAFSGFPVALIIGWMLDLKIERRKLAEADNQSEQIVKQSLRSRIAEFAVISLFGLGAAYLYYNSVSGPVQANIAPVANIDNLVEPLNVQKTIAVLPFANFSDSVQDEFFADGLSEELLNVLARNKKLRVAARTSSFQYKKTNINVKTIAEELGVQYVLEGSVRRSGDLIRITTQLINAEQDVHIFSKSWDRNSTNVFKVQDEIAQSVMDELKVSLLGENKESLSEIGTQNIAAFADYSRGLSLLRNRTKSDFEEAIINFTSALDKDPDYAEAMVMLAQTYLLQSSYGLIKSELAHRQAQPLLEKAYVVNPKLGAVHAVKGLLHWQLANQKEEKKQQLEIAKGYLAKAIDINPSLAEAYMWYGSILQNQGRFLEGAKLRQKAFEIDPQAAVVGYNRAKDLVRYGDYKQAMDVFNTVVRNNPNYPNAYTIAGDVSYAVGQLDQAYSMYHRLAELSDDDTSWLINASRLYIPMGEFVLAQQSITRLTQSSMKEYPEKYNWLQASVWIASNDLKAFYQWTSGFAEDTDHWGQRLWRGFAALKQEKWKLAVDDLSKALLLSRKDNQQRVDEHTIRIQLFLARAYIGLGNRLKFEHYLSQVLAEFEHLKQQGFDSQVLRYQQAAYAALHGENDKALKLLRQSVQEGFVDFWWAETDPAFYQIKSDPVFISIKDEFKIRIRLMKNNIETQFGKLALND
ncbi:TPR end-of-group domain-containing protein [Aliikangiella sp. IMCC44359]|uniref:TPR end-of-group domain-containing protein n=1 Tax=Aliikangiella sp. IMCC44359 TaxID=3459125 RepID=UPI00403ABAEB